MRDIVQAILNAPVPVAGYVAPSGARAASAGTYILYATHVAAMAPGTNLGAATPVRMGGLPGGAPDDRDKERKPPATDGDKDKTADKDKQADQERAPGGAPGDPMSAKAVEDAVAYIRSLAEMRGRNADEAEAEGEHA